MIFVKWKEGLWCRATVVEVVQSGCVGAVNACPVTQLSSVQVFFLDYGFVERVAIQRYAKSRSSVKAKQLD